MRKYVRMDVNWMMKHKKMVLRNMRFASTKIYTRLIEAYRHHLEATKITQNQANTEDVSVHTLLYFLVHRAPPYVYSHELILNNRVVCKRGETKK